MALDTHTHTQSLYIVTCNRLMVENGKNTSAKLGNVKRFVPQLSRRIRCTCQKTYELPECTTLIFLDRFFENSNIKFYENSSGVSRSVPCGQRQKRTKLKAAFRNFANATEVEIFFSHTNASSGTVKPDIRSTR